MLRYFCDVTLKNKSFALDFPHTSTYSILSKDWWPPEASSKVSFPLCLCVGEWALEDSSEPALLLSVGTNLAPKVGCVQPT